MEAVQQVVWRGPPRLANSASPPTVIVLIYSSPGPNIGTYWNQVDCHLFYQSLLFIYRSVGWWKMRQPAGWLSFKSPSSGTCRWCSTFCEWWGWSSSRHATWIFTPHEQQQQADLSVENNGNEEIKDNGAEINKQDEQEDMKMTIQQRQEQVITYVLTIDVQGMVQENLWPKSHEEGHVMLHYHTHLKPEERAVVSMYVIHTMGWRVDPTKC